jgi:hypothetical protein
MLPIPGPAWPPEAPCRTSYVDHGVLKVTIFLLQPPECWDYSHCAWLLRFSLPSDPAHPVVLALAQLGSPCQLVAASRATSHPAWLSTLQLPSGQQPLQQLG